MMRVPAGGYHESLSSLRLNLQGEALVRINKSLVIGSRSEREVQGRALSLTCADLVGIATEMGIVS